MTGEPIRPTGSGRAADQLGLATDVISLLRQRRETLATAESLTGGLLAAALTDVAGSSAVIRGGIIAYASEVKLDVLTVDADLLSRHGAVSAEVAVEMATRAADMFASSWAVSTTGVAGPGRQDGQPVGAAYVAVAGPIREMSAVSRGQPASALDGAGVGVEGMKLALTGSRTQIRVSTVVHALEILRNRIVAAAQDG